ncbi:hypothetical protein MPSYJ_48360 [Mycolicibacterium psychrotolerans]|uniref:PE-PPE domain-containing protein n=1 Tax=Mycolicibacterium psychrotolerans TaxID=216929 RepID=A0A7I7MGT1_9MYCO|nr:hypothetical protein MPSYJ_48360 [Mycolicibacterium psychrotolerans]
MVGLSAGSLVVNEVLRQMDADPDAPGKNEITFIVVADSSRQSLIDKARYDPRFDYTYQPAPETKYDIIVVTGSTTEWPTSPIGGGTSSRSPTPWRARSSSTCP